MKSPERAMLLLEEDGLTVINYGRNVLFFCSSLFRYQKARLLLLPRLHIAEWIIRMLVTTARRFIRVKTATRKFIASSVMRKISQ